jgi:hypothetical protein
MIPKCTICGKEPAELLAEDSGRWVRSKPIYTSLRRFLCQGCKRAYSPSMILILEKGSNEALRALPLEDEKGDLYTTTTKRQIQSHPFFFPQKHLCERALRGEIMDVIHCSDCRIVKLSLPLSGDYWISYWMIQKGYVYSLLQPWQVVEKGFVNFYARFKENGGFACVIHQSL